MAHATSGHLDGPEFNPETDYREIARLQRERIAELEASRLALIRQIDTVVWNFEHGSVTVAEHERAWRNVLASALANK